LCAACSSSSAIACAWRSVGAGLDGFERAALDASAAEQQLGEVDADGFVAVIAQLAGEADGTRGDHDVVAVGVGVEAEHGGVVSVDEDRVRVPLGEECAAVGVERPREVRDVLPPRSVVQHREGGVQVVEAGIDETQREHLTPEHLGQLAVAGIAAAESGSGEDRLADEEEVTLAFVDLAGRRDLEACGAQPVAVGGSLRLSFRVREARAVGEVADDEAAVGGVDHVGESGERLDELHVEAECDVEAVQLLPLPHREGRVRRQAGVHPRIDPIHHVEVLRRAHQDRPRSWSAHRPPGASLLLLVGDGHDDSVTHDCRRLAASARTESPPDRAPRTLLAALGRLCAA